MDIGIVGTGRVAQAMGGYLLDHGYPVRGVWGRDHHKAQISADVLGVGPYTSLRRLCSGVEIILLAVSDDSILPVAQELAMGDVDLSGKWVGHFSGSLSLDVLSAVRKRGAEVFCIHPLQTLPDPVSGRRDLVKATFMLEAEAGFQMQLQQWLQPTGNPLGWISPGKKGIYHLGACLASNYVMTLYHLAEEALTASGIEKAAASEALIPLMESTLRNYQAMGAQSALTGPVSRGDTVTVVKHLEGLMAQGWVHREMLIRELGLEALRIVDASGRLDQEKVKEMEKLLRGGSSQ